MSNRKRSLEEFLVASAKCGDREALTQLVALRGPRLLVHAARLIGDREDAKDIVQEAWLDICGGLKSLRDVRAFPAWATQIVTRRCTKVIKNKTRARKCMQNLAAENKPQGKHGGAEAVIAGQVRNAINTLPPEQGATVALFYLEDMSVTEVSLAMDVPLGTVKTRLMHARVKLKQALQGVKR